MPNTIKIKQKTTSGAPTTGQLAVGEMCWVIPDKVMYERDADGIQVVGAHIISGTSATPPSASSVPENTLYIQYTP